MMRIALQAAFLAIAGAFAGCYQHEGDVDERVWGAAVADLNGDGVVEQIVCSSYCESHPALGVHRDLAVCLDGASGGVLAQETKQLRAGLAGLITGAGSARMFADPTKRASGLLAIHCKSVTQAAGPSFDDVMVFFELPSMAVRGRIACGTKSGDLLRGQMASAESSMGLPPDRVFVLSSELIIISVASMNIVSRSAPPPTDLWFTSTLDADGDGVVDSCHDGNFAWLTIKSGRTHRELARCAWYCDDASGTTLPLGDARGSAGSVVCQVQGDASTPSLLLAKYSALGALVEQTVLPMQ